VEKPGKSKETTGKSRRNSPIKREEISCSGQKRAKEAISLSLDEPEKQKFR